VRPSSVRLAGHTLAREGKPHDVGGRPSESKWRGRALCSCRATSEVLDTDNQRKRWHREHKTQIREEGTR
jgi:hypothetical protein